MTRAEQAARTASHRRDPAYAGSMADRIQDRLRDALYVGVGLTLLGIQRAQVHRREISALVEQRADETRTVVRSVGQGLLALDDHACLLRDRVLERVRDGLPEPAKDALEQARQATDVVRLRVRERLGAVPTI